MSNYVVEKILDSRIFKGKKQYKIKWMGYSNNESTWEPEQNLKTCMKMVNEFEKQNAIKNKFTAVTTMEN